MIILLVKKKFLILRKKRKNKIFIIKWLQKRSMLSKKLLDLPDLIDIICIFIVLDIKIKYLKFRKICQILFIKY